MAKKKANKWSQPEAPPPPLFTGQKERDLVKQVNDELIERVIGQTIVYYPISREHTNYHPVYGEAVQKTFLAPIRVQALIKWDGTTNTTDVFGVDRVQSITVEFHTRRLVADQDLYVREGDFVQYGDNFYEIVTLANPRLLFGQPEYKFEIIAKCIKARDSVFNAK